MLDKGIQSLCMIGFLLKKTFYDLWDNILRIILVNLGFIVSISFPVFIPPLFGEIPVLSISLMVIGILWCSVYIAASALSLKAISDYGSFGFSDFLKNLKIIWPTGLVFGAFAILGFILLAVAIPFYIGTGSTMGLFLGAVIFWSFIVAVFTLQFFLAVRVRLDSNIIKAIKKSFLIFLDNPLFCVFSFFHNLIIFLLSMALGFLFPGPAGILLFLDEGLRLRLLKYDWLEAKTNEEGKIYQNKIPWDHLLSEEREKTGERSLKNLIFPWKD